MTFYDLVVTFVDPVAHKDLSREEFYKLMGEIRYAGIKADLWSIHSDRHDFFDFLYSKRLIYEVEGGNLRFRTGEEAKAEVKCRRKEQLVTRINNLSKELAEAERSLKELNET